MNLAPQHPVNRQSAIKQPWFWFVVGLPAAMIVISCALYYVAVQKPFGMVKKDYYKEGLAINKDLELVRQASVLAIHAVVHLDDSHRVQIKLQSKAPWIENDTLVLQFDHPVDNNKDIVLPLEPIASGIFTSEVLDETRWRLLQTEKRWYVYLYARRDNDSERWQLQTETAFVHQNDVVLNPSEH